MSERDALVVFTPSGKRGRFPVGTPLLQAARTLGVDVDSVCGGRALCGRCQVLVMEGDFAKHGVTSSAANLSPLCRRRAELRAAAAAAGGSPAVLLRADSGRPGHRRAAEQPGASPGRAQGRRRPTRSRSTRWCICTTSRCASRTCTTPPATCSACSSALEAEWQLVGLSLRPARCCRTCRRRCARAAGR